MCLFFCAQHYNDWYMLLGRISKSIPVRRTRNCEMRIQLTTPHEHRNAIYKVLQGVFYAFKIPPSITNVVPVA